jgi:hypothetical protein
MIRRRAPPRVQLHVQRAAGLAPVVGEIQLAHLADGQPGQQGIAVVTIPPLHGGAGDRLQVGQVGQELHLRRLAVRAQARVHLLQRQHVGVQLLDHPGDATGIVPAIVADAAVDVVRGDHHAPAGHF